MTQFFIYKNPRASMAEHVPYLLDVTHKLVNDFGMRMVVPLYRVASYGQPAAKLNPLVIVGNERFVLAVLEAGSLPTNKLRKPVADASPQRDAILDAIDFALRGF